MAEQDVRVLKKQIGLFDGTSLMANLDWRPISKGSVTQVVRQAKLSGQKPTHIVEVSGADAKVVGLYTQPPSEDGIKLPKSAVSAAACFAHGIGLESPDAALVMDMEDGRFYVCTIADGVPTIDKIVTSREDVTALVQYVHEIYSNDDVSFPGVAINWEWLLRHERAAKLQPTPLDTRTLVVALIALSLVIATAVGVAYIQDKKRKEKERAAEAARLAADPVPKYNAALLTAKTKAFVPHAFWTKLRDNLLDLQLTAPGWIRKGVQCDALAGVCESDWERKGGTTPELRAALKANGKDEQLVDFGQYEAYKSVLKFKPEFADPSVLKFHSEPEWRGLHAELLQNWVTAGLVPRFVGPARLWPVAEGVPAEFRADNTMGTFPALLTVPAVFLDEVIASSPSDLSWMVMQFQFNSGTDAKQRVILNMAGIQYVTLK